jgi:UDP-N-acetylmuramate dehydrogenase
MMEPQQINTIQTNVNLKGLHTFGMSVIARYFARVSSVEALTECLAAPVLPASQPLLILGGGSNLLFTQDYDGLVVQNAITGIQIVAEDTDYVYVKADAGENWHHFVMYCIAQGWGGIENLALIPGNVGASPIQNIGAYGVEIKDVFFALEAIHLREKKQVHFGAEDCAFGYRDSIFKQAAKDQYVITSVTYRLRKVPVLNTSYGAIAGELERMGITEPCIADVAAAVIHIRQSKLPDPAVVGNAGSFFKNPVVDAVTFARLQTKFPGIAAYPMANGGAKLAAGWLIEQCGWKGYRKGDAGCHDRQALVLVNYGSATGREVYDLSTAIVEDVAQRFGVQLEREVNIIPPPVQEPND